MHFPCHILKLQPYHLKQLSCALNSIAQHGNSLRYKVGNLKTILLKGQFHFSQQYGNITVLFQSQM
jgi:hypothetical protein